MRIISFRAYFIPFSLVVIYIVFFNMQHHKGDKYNSNHPTKPRKQRFHSNQHVDGQKEKEEHGESVSSRKLVLSESEDVVVYAGHGYRIIGFLSIFSVLLEFLICRTCKTNVSFAQTENCGFPFKLVV